MRKAAVYVHDQFAGVLTEVEARQAYRFDYTAGYTGAPVSLTMPVSIITYTFSKFPPYFEGVLPEGIMLEGLLRGLKIDRNDLFSQLLATGGDLVGAVTVKTLKDE
jgi:serine/threonine-protein kinase HipA